MRGLALAKCTYAYLTAGKVHDVLRLAPTH